jgi:hypothetical protein
MLTSQQLTARVRSFRVVAFAVTALFVLRPAWAQ